MFLFLGLSGSMTLQHPFMLSAARAETDKSDNSFVVPRLTGPVVDLTGILNRASKHQLEEFIRSVYSRRHIQLQVLIIPELKGEPIEQASIKVVESWKLGGSKSDQGLLLLISQKEHKVRFEVGRGLEGSFPDIYAKRVVSDTIVPLFKKGKFGLGVYAGLQKAVQLIEKNGTTTGSAQSTGPMTEVDGLGHDSGPSQTSQDQISIDESHQNDGRSHRDFVAIIVVIVILLLLSGFGGGGSWPLLWILSSLLGGGGGRGSRRDDWSGGGGGFGGGGTSGDW